MRTPPLWVSLLAGATILGSLAGQGQTAAVPAALRTAAPVVNAAAFRGQGHLAFLWNGQPYVLDGRQGTLRSLPGAGITSMSWSADGRWLAYLTATGNSGAGLL